MTGFLNPWVIIGLLISFLAVVGGSYVYGDSNGRNSQKITDQTGIDKINNDIKLQKEEAASKLKASDDKLIQAIIDRESIKSQLENDHVANQAITTDLRNKLASASLRFRSSQVSGCGNSGRDPMSQAVAPIGDASSPVVQLPDSITRDLRQLAETCDSVNDDYKLLYAKEHSVNPIGEKK